MVNFPGVSCCMPEVELQRKCAEEYPALDLCDYLISIMGRSDGSFQYKYGGCSLFEASDDFEDWTVHETYYSNDLFVPEGRLLRFLKRKSWVIPQSGPIATKILLMKSLPDSIKRCARDVERSGTKDEFLGSIINLATKIGPYLDTKYWSIPLFEREYLMIKSIGAYFKLLIDYGVAVDRGDPFSGRAQFLYLNWR